MNNFVRFRSGNEYCLKDLFSNDTKIVIPDLQRDYCWGDNAYNGKDNKPQELVSGFLNNIIELYESDARSSVTLGLVYGYEQPYNRVQICDGQQRLTTLFLLLGVLNTKCNGAFNRYIISQEEMEDDYEPHLLYAIRESTLYFLSDLSLHLFINSEIDVSAIRSSNWYFKEYDQDASIQSMLAALNTIYRILDSRSDLDYKALGEYVLNNLRVLYYDMEYRSRGEETYVVINTTGEPLSATENIKPILLGNASFSEEQKELYANQWEERVEWFWQHRGDDTTGDTGMYKFFEWYWQIGLLQEYTWKGDKKYPLDVKGLFVSAPRKMTENANETTFSKENYYQCKSPENIDSYFTALKTLVEAIASDAQIQRVLYSCNQEKSKYTLSDETSVLKWLLSSNLNIVLPLLHYVKTFGTQGLYPFVRKIRKNYYDLVWSKDDKNQPSRKSANYVDWRYIIQIINQCTDSDVLTADVSKLNISLVPNVPLHAWYSEDDIWKSLHSDELHTLEEIEDYALLMGDTTALRKGCDGTEYDVPTFCKRWKSLMRINNAFDEKSANEDKEFSNWFRLYCVVTKITTIGHIPYYSWGIVGCFFSQRKDTPWWIESNKIDSLLCSDDILGDVKQVVKKEVENYIHCPQNYKELLTAWLTLKTIDADKKGKLLDHWSGRPISAFTDMKENYIVPCDEFHWGNVLCGYAWSYTIYPARDENNWHKCENLDSPLSSIPFIPNYNERELSLNEDEIAKYDNEIKELIDDFFV